MGAVLISHTISPFVNNERSHLCFSLSPLDGTHAHGLVLCREQLILTLTLINRKSSSKLASPFVLF